MWNELNPKNKAAVEKSRSARAILFAKRREQLAKQSLYGAVSRSWWPSDSARLVFNQKLRGLRPKLQRPEDVMKQGFKRGTWSSKLGKSRK